MSDLYKLLKKGDKKAQQAYLQTFYRSMFFKYNKMSCTVKDGAMKSLGVNRLIYFGYDGNRIAAINEQLYRFGTTVNMSVTSLWIEKRLAADYICCMFVSTKKCYLINCNHLQAIWAENKATWMKKYHTVPQNKKALISIPIETIIEKIKEHTQKTL